MSLDALVLSGVTPLDGVTEIEVLERLGQPSEFRVRLDVAVADGGFPTLSNSSLDPGTVITVIASGACLIRGPVGRHRVWFNGLADGSTLDVTGRDRCADLDAAAKITSWTNMRASDAVMAISAAAGLVPDVKATPSVFSELTHELVQHGTDLEFVQRLARRYGYRFWVTSTALGVDTAHFKPAPIDLAPSTTLTMHRGDDAFDSLVLEWDAERPTSVTAAGLDLASVGSLDGAVAESPLPAMADQRLGTVTAGPRPALVCVPGDSGADIAAAGESLLADADLFVTASAATNVARTGTVIRAHETVDLDGLGNRYSGTWLVSEVRHLIDAVSHRMECRFARNGWDDERGGVPSISI